MQLQQKRYLTKNEGTEQIASSPAAEKFHVTSITVYALDKWGFKNAVNNEKILNAFIKNSYTFLPTHRDTYSA